MKTNFNDFLNEDAEVDDYDYEHMFDMDKYQFTLTFSLSAMHISQADYDQVIRMALTSEFDGFGNTFFVKYRNSNVPRLECKILKYKSDNDGNIKIDIETEVEKFNNVNRDQIKDALKNGIGSFDYEHHIEYDETDTVNVFLDKVE
jgi:hypothetical protein